MLPTSLFWFPAPENPAPEVVGYLAREREFVTGGPLGARLVLLLLVVCNGIILAATRWRDANPPAHAGDAG